MITSIPSPFQLPPAPGVLCVIVDASFAPDLQAQADRLVGYGAERCCPLFDNTRYAPLQSAGPHAVLCPDSPAFIDYASRLLEQADAGCVGYLEHELRFEQAVEHWRSLLTVSTDDTSTQMMRFFDPRWLEPLLCSLDAAELLRFMGPITDITWRNELGWRHQARPASQAPFEVQPRGWLHLGHERQQQMDQCRLNLLAERFAQDYQAHLPSPEPVAFVYRQLLAAQQAGYVRLPEQERWLRLSLSKGDGFWRQRPQTELLARDDLTLGDKLTELERL